MQGPSKRHETVGVMTADLRHTLRFCGAKL